MSFSAVVERLRTLSNPYPGLRPFETSESHLFFGRDRQVAELVGRLEQHRFLAVVGLSGSGKSSLVRAGLIPAIDRGRLLGAGRRWRTVVTRPSGSPIARLSADLERAGLDPAGVADSSHGLIAVAAQLESDESLLVVVDQFEELFRYKDAPLDTDTRQERRRLEAAEAAEFVQLLLAASRHQRPVYVVLTMRSDYLGDCAEFRDLPETLNDCQYLVPRMTREQRKQAIEVPLGRTQIAPSLVQRMLNDAGDEPDQLPVLQHALMRTWNRWREADPRQERRIELEDYVAIGGFEHAIDEHAEAVYASVDPTIAETMFKRLTARGRGQRERRDPATLDEICALCGATTEEGRARVVAVVDRFRLGDATFLTPRDSRLGGPTFIDITHESLIRQWQRLRESWLAEEQQSAKKLASLVERARDWDAGKAKPLFDLDLAEALDWDRRRNKTPAWSAHYANAKDVDLLQRFLDASTLFDRRQRLRKRGLWIVTPLAAAFAVLAVVAVYQTRQAVAARTVSVARQLAAQGQLLQSEHANLEPGVLLAIEAFRRFPAPDTERALRQSVARLPRQVATLTMTQDGRPDPVRLLSVSPDGASVAVVTYTNTVKIFETTTWRESTTRASAHPVLAIVAVRPGAWRAVLSEPDGVFVRELPGDREIRRFPSVDFPGGTTISRDGKYVVSTRDEALVMWNVDTGHASVVPVPQGRIEPLAFSADGRVAIGIQEEGPDQDFTYSVRVMEMATAREEARFEFTSPVRALAFGRNGRLLAAADTDGTARVFDMEDATEPVRMDTAALPMAIALSDDARVLATGNVDGTSRVFDVSSEIEIARLAHQRRDAAEASAGGPPPEISAIAISPDGRLVFSGGADGAVRVFEAAGANDVVRLSGALPVTALAFGNGGQRLVAGSGHVEAAQVRVLDAPEWREVARFTPPSPEVRAIGVSADARFVGVASNWFGGPWIYDMQGAGNAPSALGGPPLMTSVSLSGDGRFVAATANYKGYLYDRAGAKAVPVPTLSGQVQAFTLSADGTTAVAGIGDIEGGAVVVLKLPEATESARIAVTGPALFVAASADGRWVAASGLAQSPVVHVIDIIAKKEVWQHTGTTETVAAFSPDGTTVALVSADGTLRTFDTATGAPGLRAPVRGVRALAFDAGNRSLTAGVIQPTLAAGNGATVMRYILSPDDLARDACERVTRNLTPAEWGRYVGADVPYSRTCSERP